MYSQIEKMDKNFPTPPRWKKVVSSILSFLILFQSTSYVYASTAQFVDMLSNSHSYEVDSANHEQLYKGVFTPTEPHLDGMAYFYDSLKESDYQAFNGATLVPVDVAGISIFIPYVPAMPTRIGTSYVESGLIRYQMTELLGRGWIGGRGYTSYNQQSHDLYDKGLEFLAAKNLKFGQPLTPELKAGLIEDMIWPEIRLVNGQEVLFPIVYLTDETIAAHKITGSTLAADSANFDTFSFAATGVDINIRRNVIINVRDDFILTGGGITAGEDLNITAGRNIENYSGAMSADSINLVAQEIYNGTLVTQHHYAHGYDSQFDTVGTITAVGDININSFGQVVFEGGSASAQGDIRIQADGNIILISKEAIDEQSQSGRNWEYQERSLTNLQTQLSAADSISLLSGGQIYIQGAQVEAQGLLEILSAYGVQVLNDVDYHSTYSYMEWDSTDPLADAAAIGAIGIGGGTEGSVTKRTNREDVVRALLSAGKDLRIYTTNGDITLRAVRAVSDGVIDLIAPDGSINIELAISRDLYDFVMQDENATSIYNKSNGHVQEVVSYTEFEAKGGIEYEAGAGVFVQVGMQEGQKQELDVIIDQLSESAPSLAWMKQLKDDPAISTNWSEVEFVVKEWDEEFAGLTPEAMAVVAIAIAIATSGVGAGFVGAGTATVTATAGGAMASAAFTSIVTTASLSLANNGFDIEQTFKELGSSDNLKALATTMVTAGLISAADFELFASIGEAEAAGEVASITDRAYQAATHAFIAVSTDMIINEVDISEFEEQFKVALTHKAIALVGEVAANELGRYGQEINEQSTTVSTAATVIHKTMRYVGHAALGCVLGAATSDAGGASIDENQDQCITGGLAAVVGEVVAEQYIQSEMADWTQGYADSGTAPTNAQMLAQIDKWKTDGVDLAKMTAAIGAFLAGADVNIAAMTAENAAENNLFFVPVLYVVLMQAVVLTTYAAIIGNGSVVDGLNQIQDDTNALGAAVAAAVNQAKDGVVAYAIETNPSLAAEVGNTIAVLDEFTKPMAEGVVVTFQYIDDKTKASETVTAAWNELTDDQQKQLRASVTFVSFILPVATLTRMNTLTNIDGYEPGMLRDLSHTSYDNLSVDDRETLQLLPGGSHALRGDVHRRDASAVNEEFPEGYASPYKPGTLVTEFTTQAEIIFVRVYGDSNEPNRGWMMRAEDIEGLSPAEIKAKFALPSTPRYVTEVHVPGGYRMREGIVNPNFEEPGGGVQYQTIGDRLPAEAFLNARVID